MEFFGRKIRRVLTLGVLLSSAILSAEETSGSHTPPAIDDPQAQATARVLTRQEALVKGLREMKLPQPTLKNLLALSEKNPQSNAADLLKALESIPGSEAEKLSDPQKKKVTELINSELGQIPKGVGREFGSAVRTLIDPPPATTADGKTTPGAIPTKTDTGTATGGTPPSGTPISSNGEQALQAFANKAFGDLQKKFEESFKGQLSAAQELVKKAEDRLGDGGGNRGALRPQGTQGLLANQLAQLLQGQQKNGEKQGDNSKGNQSPQPPQPPQHSPSSKNEDRDSDDDKKSDLAKKPDRDGDRRRERDRPITVNNTGNGNGSNDNQKNDGKKDEKKSEFSLPTPKEKKDDFKDLKAKTKKADDALNPASSTGTDTDGNDILSALNSKGKKAKFDSKATTLQPIQKGGDGGLGGFGGPGGGGGEGGGGGGGGPPIAGGGGGGGGGGFGGGDPFSGVGQDDYGPPSGPMNLIKPVEYGSSSSAGGSDTSGMADGEGLGDFDANGDDPLLNKVRGQSKKFAESISSKPLPPKKAPSAIFYVGQWKKSMCDDGLGQQVGVCQKLALKKSRLELRKRLQAVQAVTPN